MTLVDDNPDTTQRPSRETPTFDMQTFGEVLRQYRKRAGLTQDAAAEAVPVSRVTFTQWESGKHLPTAAKVLALDELLAAGGELIAAAEQSRSRGPRARSAEPATDQLSVRQIRDYTRRALLNQLHPGDDDDTPGFRHNLVPSRERTSTLSTVYGIHALSLLGVYAGQIPAVVERVLREGVAADGRIIGWRATSQPAPRLEMTGTAITGLLRSGVVLDREEIIRALAQAYDRDDAAREHPFILISGLEPLLRVAPDSELARTFTRALLDMRIGHDERLLWPEKLLSRDQPKLVASVAHTAHAVTVLRDAPDELVGDAVITAEQWLAEQTNLGGVTETIRRMVDGRIVQDLTVHHFTAAWQVRALAGAPVPDREALARALQEVWNWYDPATHFWAWGNGDVPTWLLRDAVAAVQDAAYALTATPIRDG